MTASFGQRVALLAAVALLAGVAAIAAVDHKSGGTAAAALTSAPAPAGWNTAFAGSRGPTGDAERTTCGQLLTPQSLGITHPVLPCGAKVVLRYGSKNVLTEVVDNSLRQPGRQIELTERLAKMLGIDGTVELEWRFATDSGQ